MSTQIFDPNSKYKIVVFMNDEDDCVIPDTPAARQDIMSCLTDCEGYECIKKGNSIMVVSDEVGYEITKIE